MKRLVLASIMFYYKVDNNLYIVNISLIFNYINDNGIAINRFSYYCIIPLHATPIYIILNFHKKKIF